MRRHEKERKKPNYSRTRERILKIMSANKKLKNKRLIKHNSNQFRLINERWMYVDKNNFFCAKHMCITLVDIEKLMSTHRD